MKIKAKHYVVFSVTIFFVLFVIISNEQIALSTQKWFKKYELVNIGTASIHKPENWFFVL